MVNPDTRTVLFEDRKLLPAVGSVAELPEARPGQICLVEEEDRFYRFTGSEWAVVDESAGAAFGVMVA